MASFESEVQERIAANGRDSALKAAARGFMMASLGPRYSYNFSWLGRPIIQYPQDMMAMQEIIWSVQPDLIIETGIAHGGSLIFSAAMQELNAACGGPVDAEVIGIDIDIRPHNRKAIENHPMFKRISMIEGSSIAGDVIGQVREKALGKAAVLVCLDSMHTHDHVLAELEAYSPLVTGGSYCVVFDTIIEEMPAALSENRPWGHGDNPKSAVRSFLKDHDEFVIDAGVENKLLVTVAPGGFLKKVGHRV
jgi:cephalosporin hydroxylase